MRTVLVVGFAALVSLPASAALIWEYGDPEVSAQIKLDKSQGSTHWPLVAHIQADGVHFFTFSRPVSTCRPVGSISDAPEGVRLYAAQIKGMRSDQYSTYASVGDTPLGTAVDVAVDLAVICPETKTQAPSSVSDERREDISTMLSNLEAMRLDMERRQRELDRLERARRGQAQRELGYFFLNQAFRQPVFVPPPTIGLDHRTQYLLRLYLLDQMDR